MINNRVTIFSNTDMNVLSRDINTFIKWQEAIGNVINDIKFSSCESTYEAMVIWQMVSSGNEADIGYPLYSAIFKLDNVRFMISTDDTRIIQQIIDLKELIEDCEICQIIPECIIDTLYKRKKVPHMLNIPSWRKEVEE